MTLYMVTTNDEYELPLIVSDNQKDIAEYTGANRNSVKRAFYRSKHIPRSIYQSVEVDDEEDDYSM